MWNHCFNTYQSFIYLLFSFDCVLFCLTLTCTHSPKESRSCSCFIWQSFCNCLVGWFRIFFICEELQNRFAWVCCDNGKFLSCFFRSSECSECLSENGLKLYVRMLASLSSNFVKQSQSTKIWNKFCAFVYNLGTLVFATCPTTCVVCVYIQNII